MRIDGFETSQHLTSHLNEFSKAATSICRKLAEQQLEILSGNIALISDHAKRLSNAKNPADFLTTQKECLAEDLSTLGKNIQKVLTTSIDSMQELTKACGSTKTKTTTIKMKTKTKKTKKRSK